MAKQQTPELAVEARGLVKVFGDHRAVDGIDLHVPAGTIYGVLGPNGAGKTTTINMLATLLRPDGGTATIFGHNVEKEPQIVRQLIGVTGQYASVDEALSATENLVIFSRLLGLNKATAKQKAAELLEEFDLTEAAKRPLAKFSGGMRRRLDLAVSLIAQPPLLFLDEPTTGLDPRTRSQMWSTIRRLVDTGSTVLLTTQYLDEADQLADRIAVIDKGKVVAEGTPNELKKSVGTAALQVRNGCYANTTPLQCCSSNSKFTNDYITLHRDRIQLDCSTDALVLAFLVYYIVKCFVSQIASQVLGEDCERTLIVLSCQARDMRADENVRHMPEWTVSGQRLSGKNVQCGSGDALFLQGTSQGVFITDLSTGNIDKESSRLHGMECSIIKQPGCAPG
jgi:ABC-2 type transport system ATP-binding protein